MKVLDSKSSVVTSHRGFESHPLRHNRQQQDRVPIGARSFVCGRRFADLSVFYELLFLCLSKEKVAKRKDPSQGRQSRIFRRCNHPQPHVSPVKTSRFQRRRDRASMRGPKFTTGGAFVCEPSSSGECHLPIQNLLKISLSTSSPTDSPVSSLKHSSAACRSIDTKSTPTLSRIVS